MAPQHVALLLLLLPTLAASQANWDASLHLLPPARVAEFDARCLDGSAPGYYIRRASNPASATKWKIHACGGGWCTSLADCASRANTLLGSSTTWPPWLSALWPPEGAGFYGLMDANETNPFGSWNFVWLAYCDGTSQTSDVTGPVDVHGQTIHLRGRAILDANLAELEANEKFLSTATEVIFSGTSAGGISVYLQSSVVRSLLTAPGARLAALPDAGYFLDHATMNPPHDHAWLATLTQALVFWNATLRGDAAQCAASNAAAPARCLFPQYIFPFSTVPHFILQSIMDTANLGICFSSSCNIYTSCTPEQAAQILQYGEDLRSNVTASVALFGARDGYFMTSCYQHEESCRPEDWYGIQIGGQNANSTFFNWYTAGSGASPSARRSDLVWPGDVTCAPQSDSRHGAC